MSKEMAAARVILAAGGTAGHLFPARALAQALSEHSITTALVTDQRGADLLVSESELPCFCIQAQGFRSGITANLQAVYKLGRGSWQAYRLLREIRPSLVVGFGGYASVPSVQAAHLLGIEVVLHEQNVLLGKANRLRCERARHLAISFPQTAGIPKRCLSKVIHTGNPVSSAVRAARDHSYPALRAERIQLLVLGGSQGASVFSRVLPATLALMPAELRARLQLTAQCRSDDLPAVAEALAGLGLPDPVLSHFFADVPERMVASDLILTRAGAATIAELTAIGRPAILVPYPHAAQDHQTANANALEQAGAAWRIPESEFTPARLAQALSSLLAAPDQLVQMAGRAAELGLPDASERLAQLIVGLLPTTRWRRSATQ